MFAVDFAVFMHVVNLEGLTADGTRSNVVVVTAKEDGLGGKLQVFSLGEVTDEHVIFINISSQSPNEGDDGEQKEPPSEVGFGEAFVTVELFRGGPVDDGDVEDDEGDDEELFDALAFKKGLFFLSHKMIILEKV